MTEHTRQRSDLHADSIHDRYLSVSHCMQYPVSSLSPPVVVGGVAVPPRLETRGHMTGRVGQNKRGLGGADRRPRSGSWRRRIDRIGSKRRGPHAWEGRGQITPCRRVLVSVGQRVGGIELRFSCARWPL